MEKRGRGRPRKNPEAPKAPAKNKKVSKVEIEVTDGEVTNVKKVKAAKVIAPALKKSKVDKPEAPALTITKGTESAAKKATTPKRTSDGTVVMEADKDDAPTTGGKTVVFRGGKPVLVDDKENPDID